MQFVDDKITDPTELLDDKNNNLRITKQNWAAIKTTSASKVRFTRYHQIRKKTKEDRMIKRRTIPDIPETNNSNDSIELDYDCKSIIESFRIEIYRCLQNRNFHALQLAFKRLRKYILKHGPYHNVIAEAICTDDKGEFIKQIISLMFIDDRINADYRIKIDNDSLNELLFIVQLLVEGDNYIITNFMISMNVVQLCIKILCNNNEQKITERCLFILGNIAGDYQLATRLPHPFDSTTSVNIRDFMLLMGVPNVIVNIASGRPWSEESLRQFYPEKDGDDLLYPCPSKHIKETTLFAMAYCISNLSRCTSSSDIPPFELIKVAAQLLSNLLPEHNDRKLDIVSSITQNNIQFETMIEAIWGITNMTTFIETNSDQIDHILATRCGIKIVNLLTYKSTRVILPCLRICGQICAGTNMQTQNMVSFGLMINLLPFIGVNKIHRDIKKEALWTLSNVLCTDLLIEKACHTGIFQLLAHNLKHGQAIVKVEVLHCINNICTSGGEDRVYDLWAHGIYSNLVEALDPQGEIARQDFAILKYVLECVLNLIKLGNRHSQMCKLYCSQPAKMSHMARGLAATSRKLLLLPENQQEFSETDLIVRGKDNLVLQKFCESGHSPLNSETSYFIDNLINLSDINDKKNPIMQIISENATKLIQDWNLDKL